MDCRKLISESWVHTKENKKLIIWYGFLPAVLSTLIGIIYFGYQIYSTWRSQLFDYHGTSALYQIFATIGETLQNNTQLGLILLAISAFVIILYLAIPTILQGSLISISARIINKQEISLLKGISYGLLSFLPMVEYHLMIKSLGFLSVVAEAAFVARNLGWLWIKMLFIPFLLYAIIGFVLMVLFTYTEYYIIIDDEPVFTAIKKSCSLVIKHWAETFLMSILMLIIIARIIINIILVILIPMLIIIPAGYFSSIALANAWIILAGVIGLIGLLVASYFAAIIDVFATFVWVNTFLYLTTKGDVSAREKGEEFKKPIV